MLNRQKQEKVKLLIKKLNEYEDFLFYNEHEAEERKNEVRVKIEETLKEIQNLKMGRNE